MQPIFLKNKIHYLEVNFEDLTAKLDELHNRIKYYVELQDNNHYVTVAFVDDYKVIKKELDGLISDTYDSFQDQHYVGNPNGYCQFKEHCPQCIKNINEANNHDYCASICNRCKSFRKLTEQQFEKDVKLYFDEHMAKEYMAKERQPVQEPKKSTNMNSILTLGITNNYIQTKDLIFYVTITTSESGTEDRLRYIFTYLMCGSSGRLLFPNESKHSKSVTFPVAAAKYDIVNNANGCMLQGVLRYKYQKQSSMTMKKLELMGNDKYIIKAYCPNICNNNKTHLVKNDIDRFIDTIRHSTNGSNIEDFYIQDN